MPNERILRNRSISPTALPGLAYVWLGSGIDPYGILESKAPEQNHHQALTSASSVQQASPDSRSTPCNLCSQYTGQARY